VAFDVAREVPDLQPTRHELHAIAREVLRGAPPHEAPLLAWPLVSGARVAERCAAQAFADGVLTVAVPDGAWRGQLVEFRTQYLAALGRLLGPVVRQIDFIIVAPQARP
jgi:hypothetical protein